MLNMLVLDSNTISYYMRGDPQVVPRMQALRPADVGVPVIVEYEPKSGSHPTPIIPAGGLGGPMIGAMRSQI